MYAPLITGAVAGADKDPFFANVVLLCGFAGADASTSFTDESSFAHTLTASGTAQVDTSQSKFGGSSLQTDASANCFVSSANSTDWQFGTGTFTIEFFIRLNALTNTKCLISYGNGGSDGGWFLRKDGGPNVLRWQIASASLSPAWSPSTGVWYHICVERDGSNKLRIYVDGAMIGSTTMSTNSGSSGRPLEIGQQFNQTTTAINAWFDEVRITKGVARYASDGGFTVPSARYPRS
jgi:hypothetical protein